MNVPAMHMERLLPGPIERVWDYLTDPELVATWLDDGHRRPRPEIRRCEPPAVLEYVWTGDSSVRFDLEPRGQDVLLRLTHRRLPACFVGVCTVLAVGLAFFMLGAPSDARRDQRQMDAAHAAPILNSIHLDSRHFTVC